MSVTKRKRSVEKEELIENGDVNFSGGHSNIKGDEINIAVLLFLYTLQGIPLGLAGAIPMLLQNRGITYTQQAEFSFVNWPFSVKLLWAPIVDALFWPEFGRRKTWLVPVQYLIGIVMIIMSSSISDWLGSEDQAPSMMILTISFLFLNFLAATQDIAVDGWALTMLKRCNVGHASTCNTVGQTAGFFLGYVLFLALESPYFCNKYLRTVPEDTGLVTLSSFLLFWGWVFIITTTIVALFKHENNDTINNPQESQVKGIKDIVNAYKQLLTIVKLPAVRTLALVLFTAKLGFCASDAVSGLKLVEAGVPREDLALLAVPLVPVQIIMPVILSKYTTGPAPLSLWLRAFPLRLLVGPLAAALVAITPSLLGNSGPSYSYLFILLCLYIFHQTCLYCMFVAVMAFFAKVSDPAVGGTYMTLLNTVSNLGTNWPNTLALWAIDHLTFKTCSPALSDNTCSSPFEVDECKASGGTCVVSIDGFYIETVICLIAGFLWLQWGRSTINRLQRLPASAWQIARVR
ncbi:PREDICTED: acetyl-coenzyme A transporter 1 [Papilio xuthus]|uniref:Acetyl-coenzyme A transporter 1 n=1 Tax=Papilio xuthus TaxID=66420 RepID=A0A194PLX2_PAPXU|nr:PREDICTED: acetyl-coenzyme A transporter 1 [Papilio xuthus]KPI94436.1 Acetyl-coenzyme A transporter 1 [Papilio xuthus]